MENLEKFWENECNPVRNTIVYLKLNFKLKKEPKILVLKTWNKLWKPGENLPKKIGYPVGGTSWFSTWKQKIKEE